jgi:two-component system, NtrC family, sensor histidine kinase GlrK
MSVSDSELRASLRAMFHDLRTPLGPVIGFGETLLDEKAGPLTAQQREMLEKMLASGRDLLKIIENSQLSIAAILDEHTD